VVAETDSIEVKLAKLVSVNVAFQWHTIMVLIIVFYFVDLVHLARSHERLCDPNVNYHAN
jgi:hypothetical protein